MPGAESGITNRLRHGRQNKLKHGPHTTLARRFADRNIRSGHKALVRTGIYTCFGVMAKATP